MRRFLILVFSLFLVFSCGKKRKRDTTQTVSQQKTYFKKKETVKKEKKEEEIYVYQGYKYRNPFYPLVGSTVKRETKPIQEQISGLNIESFVLQGIMIDSSGKKYALLQGSDGLPYTLKGRKLFGPDGKVVPGVAGSVMEEKVILIKGGKTVTLSLPENQ
ncbi:MAG: hypothetical protein DRI36_01460 [Caldiserica bacterium]|nr:MAG: hypothetical protein DRI36_01460 [Caldisericota bacterium]